MILRPLVYVASPYSKGDSAINTGFQIKVFNELMDEEKVWPFIPTITHFLHINRPRPYNTWLNYCKVLLKRFDAVLRLDIKLSLPEMYYEITESRGAAEEVELAKKLGIPVFNDKTSLYDWVDNWKVKTEKAMKEKPNSRLILI